MKAFIAGVITLSLLIATITVNAFLIIKKTDIILDEIWIASISLLLAEPRKC